QFMDQMALLRERIHEKDVKKRQTIQDLERKWFQALPYDDYLLNRSQRAIGWMRADVLEKHGVKFPPEFLCEKLTVTPIVYSQLAAELLCRQKDEKAIPRLLQIAALKPDTFAKANAIMLAREVLEQYDPNAIARARKPSSK